MKETEQLLVDAGRRIDLYRHQKFRHNMADIAARFISQCPPEHNKTLKHSLRVALLAEATAIELHLDGGPAFCGGVVHDWGKLEIPPETLYRTIMDPADYPKIKVHTIIGYRHLIGENWFLAFIAGTHHLEGLNGYGIDFERDLVLLERNCPGTRWYVEAIRNIVSASDYVDASRRPTSPLDGSGQGSDLFERMSRKYPGRERIIDAALFCRNVSEDYS